MLRVMLGSVAVDVDHGQLVKGSLQDCPLVIRLHALAPVGRWSPGGYQRRRHKICEPVEKLNRRKVDDTVRSWPHGRSRAAQADPVRVPHGKSFRAHRGGVGD